MRVPVWAHWVSVGPLTRPGTPEDLAAIEWIVARSPNPNSRPVTWWIDQIENDTTQSEEALALISFWVMASYVCRNPLLMFQIAQVEALMDIEWTFTVPAGDVTKAALSGHLPSLRSSPDVPLIGSFWHHVLAMTGPETRWTWHRRQPQRRGGKAHASHTL